MVSFSSVFHPSNTSALFPPLILSTMCASELCNSFYRDRRDLNHFLLISPEFSLANHNISRQFSALVFFSVNSFNILTLTAFQVIVFRFSLLFEIIQHTFECVSI